MDAAREQVFQSLTTNLEDLTKLYRQMLELVRKEKDLLLSANLELLNANNEAKETLLMKISLTDAVRLKLAGDAAAVVGANAQAPRLLEIAAKAGGAIADRLRSLHSALETLLGRIAEINKANAEHTVSALKFLNGAMNDIKGTLSGKKTYERRGQYKQGPDTTGHFVSKEA